MTWGLEATFQNMPEVKLDELFADVALFVAQFRVELWEKSEKFSHDRTFMFKFMRLMERFPGAKIDFSTSRTAIDVLNRTSETLIKYEIITTENGITTLTMHFDDLCFQLYDLLLGAGALSMLAKTLVVPRKDIYARFEKELGKEYPYGFSIRELA